MTDDPLAPVPTKVDEKDIEPPALRVQWTFEPKIDDAAESRTRPSLTQPPALDSSNVYTVQGDIVRAIALEDGVPRWEIHFIAPIELPPLPVVGGIAVATARRWSWVDQDGRVVATLKLERQPSDATAVAAGIVQVDATGAQLIVGPQDGVEPTPRWDTEIRQARAVSLAPGGEEVYVTDASGAITAVATTSGNVLWSQDEARAIPSRVAVDSRTLYVVGNDDRLRAFRRRNGRRAWIGKRIGVRIASAPVVVDEVVWVAGLDAALHGFDANNGSHLFRVEIAGRAHIDLVSWDRWVIASPVYGPWMLVRAPMRAIGPSDPGLPRQYTIASGGDLEHRPAAGAAGVVLTDASGTVRLLKTPPLAVPTLAEESNTRS